MTKARPTLVTAAATLALMLLLSPGVRAQKAELTAEPSPYFVNTPVSLQVLVTGLEQEPEPTLSFSEPIATTGQGRARLTQTGVSPSFSTMIQFVNGRVERIREAKFVFNITLTADATGRYRIGAFEAEQNGVVVKTAPAVISFETIPNAAGQRIRLVLPTRVVRIGERVPITLQWWSEAETDNTIFGQAAVIPMLEDSKHLRVRRVELPATTASITITTAAGGRDYPARMNRVSKDGRKWIVRSVPLTAMPLVEGNVMIAASTLTVTQAVSWRRDVFGRRTPNKTRKLRATDIPRTLKVKPLPLQGRPDSFSGAVGNGFSIDVTADRTVVAVGEPVRLTISLGGNESLEGASLPPLDKAGLSRELFTWPKGPLAGITQGVQKRFEISVRVLRSSVDSIPPIEFSWFDPQAGRYKTTSSQPIALSVKDAVVVGADAVVTSANQGQEKASATDRNADDTNATANNKAGSSARDTVPSASSNGADLAISQNLDELARDGRRSKSAGRVNSAFYLGGLFFLAAGAWGARKRGIDPSIARNRKHLAELEKQVERAASAKELADALRRLAVAGRLDSGRREKLNEVLAVLDEASFSPDADRAVAPEQVKNKARELAAELAQNQDDGRA